jgi:hypothetical protein
MIPTIEEIQAAFPPRTVDREKATAIHGLMGGVLSPDDYPSVRRWVAQCFHLPPARARVLLAINEILDAHGVESVSLETAPYDRCYGQVVVEYINMGDPYIATVTRNRAGVWRVEGYADALERAETAKENES